MIGKHLIETYGKQPAVWLALFLTMIAEIIWRVCIPIFIALIAAEAINSDTYQVEFLLFLAVGFMSWIFLQHFSDHVFVVSTDKRYKHLVGDFFERIMHKTGAFYQEHTGALSSIFRDHLDGTINIFRLIKNDIIPIIVAVFVPTLVLFFLDFWIALIYFCAVSLRAIFSYYSMKNELPLRAKTKKIYRRLSALISDKINHWDIVRSAGFFERDKTAVLAVAQQEQDLFRARHILTARFDTLGDLLTAFAFCSIFFLVLHFSQSASNNIFILFLTVIFIINGMAIARDFGGFCKRWNERWVEVSSSLIIKNGQDQILINSSQEQPNDGCIKLEKLSKIYANAKQAILQDLDVDLPAGSHVAILGENGAGKSTFMKILLGLEEYSAGKVSIGGFDLSSKTDLFYQSLSYVPQAPTLFNATLLENLAYYNQQATEDEIYEVLRLVGMSDFVSSKEERLDYIVGEQGNKLSGGEKQRVAIARALLRDAKVYIFDEPTSALDIDTACDLMAKIKTRLAGKTFLAITHSEKVAAVFGDIYKIKAGKLEKA